MRISERIAVGAEYLKALEHSRWSSWEEGYADYCDGSVSTLEALTLAHPQWHLAASVAREAIQGPRSFEATELMAGGSCESRLIWGYDCPIPTSIARQQDHVFPYGLGGPTVASNRLTLCSIHNQVKAGDVHLFPWEHGEPPWLASMLERLARHRGS